MRHLRPHGCVRERHGADGESSGASARTRSHALLLLKAGSRAIRTRRFLRRRSCASSSCSHCDTSAKRGRKSTSCLRRLQWTTTGISRYVMPIRLHACERAAHRRSSQAIVNGMLALACESKRTGDLFGNKNLFARASKIVGGLKARRRPACALVCSRTERE